MTIDPQGVQDAINQHDAELTLLRNLVGALLDSHPNKAGILASFKRQTEGYCNVAPAGTDPEYIVEVRARLAMYLQALA